VYPVNPSIDNTPLPKKLNPATSEGLDPPVVSVKASFTAEAHECDPLLTWLPLWLWTGRGH
jgi:hypothetical protein